MKKRYTDRKIGVSLSKILRGNPAAVATMHGNRHFPDISGTVKFYRSPVGVLVSAHITGLPAGRGVCDSPVFAFHIHDGRSCSGTATDFFADAGVHYNPQGCPHPYHAGDMPPLFCANGTAILAFLTNRFELGDIIGRTVIIHSGVDDFSSQPAGGAGAKIACGKIRQR